MRGGGFRLRWRLLVYALGAYALGAIAPASASAVINVSPAFTTDTVSPVDGKCSLREAVISDNTDLPSGLVVGECPASQDGVAVPPGAFSLTTAGEDDLSLVGDLDLTGDSTIAGAGPGLTSITQTIAGQRVLHLDGLTGVPAIPVTNMKITGGTLSAASGDLYGAGVFVDGDASTSALPDLKNVLVVGNTITATGTAVARGAGVGANAPAASTPLRLEDVTVQNNDTTGTTSSTLGSGVSAVQDLVLSRTRLNGNDAFGNVAQGGGAWAGGIDVARSVIEDNSASAPGAGSGQGALGGGVYVGGLGSSFLDSTFSVNDVSASGAGRSLGGGIYLDSAVTEPLTNLTISANTVTGSAADFRGGGGIATAGGGTTRLSFVTLADNTAPESSAIARLPDQDVELRGSAIDAAIPAIACGAPTLGGTNTGSYTSIGDNAGVGTSCSLTGSGDLQGLAAGALGLAALADATGGLAAYQAGAPGTKGGVTTRRPTSSSQVVDRVGPCTDAAGATILTDARGLSRPQGTMCDAGAMEVEYRTLNVSVFGSGTVTGPGISCPGDCGHSAIDGTVLNLTATPAAGFSFGGWGGDCSGTGGCSVTLSSTRFVSAQFSPPPGAQPPPQSGSGFDLGAAIKKCKRKFRGKAKAKARKSCIRKAKRKAKA